MYENTKKINSWRDGVSAGDHCLSLDALQNLMDGGPSDLKDTQHLSGCAHCQAELAMLKSFASSLPAENDQAAVDWIAAQLRRAQDIPASSVPIPFWHGLLRVPNLAGAAAFMLIVGLGFSLYVSSRQERPLLHGKPSETQNMRSGDIRLAAPSGDLDRTPKDFRWEALPLAKSYSIQLLEVDGSVLWSGQSAENILIASPELKAKMRPGKTFFWKVTALDASGKPIASSSPDRFRIMVGQRP